MLLLSSPILVRCYAIILRFVVSNFSYAHAQCVGLLCIAGLLVGCGHAAPVTEARPQPTTERLTLPALAPHTGDGPLRVVATTGLVGDVVGRVGGAAIDLTVLMGPGQDPHSYQPGAADLAAVADADLIFVNGWHLEEGLLTDLAAIAGAPFVPVSAGITPRRIESDRDHEHGPADPHVWQDVGHVGQWAENVRLALRAADPANAAAYDANAAAYRATLAELAAELRQTLAAIPTERRVFVTNHDNLGYFTAAYDFTSVGAVIPSVSSLAEPTAAGLAALIDTMRATGVCAVVVEAGAADDLARVLQNELTGCDEVRLIALYTDALGAAGSAADSYPGLMRANAAALVEGLR